MQFLFEVSSLKNEINMTYFLFPAFLICVRHLNPQMKATWRVI